MADIVETVVWRSSPVTGIKAMTAVGLMVAQNDTMTFGELTDILAAQAFRMDTGATTTCTDATNIVTLTAALTNCPILVTVTGT